MIRIRQNHICSTAAFICLSTSVLFISTAGMAQEKKPGFLDRLFGSGEVASVRREGAENIAWKAELPPGLYDGDYSICVTIADSERLRVESSVIAHFNQPARITGAAAYVRRLSEDGDVGGEFLEEGLLWDTSLGEVLQLGSNTTAIVPPGSPKTISDLVFVITEVSGADTNVCLTELEIYGTFEEEENVPGQKSGLEGNWVVEYSDSDAITGETSFGYYSIWPGENVAATGTWNYSACGVPGDAACGSGQFSVSPEGKIQHQHGYGFMGLWGGFSSVKQVGPDELRGRWTYQDRYGGAEVWRRVRAEVSRVVLSSDVADDFDPGRRPGRVEKTYDGYWWGPTVSARATRPGFNITVYGKNLWGRHDIRISPRLATDDLILSDLELLCCGNVFGRGREVAGLGMEVLAWAGAVPGRKIVYVDDIAIPFDFIVHGHPQSPEVSLTFKEKKGDSWTATNPEGVSYGAPFKVEAEFREVPTETPVIVRLEWDDSQEPVDIAVHAVGGAGAIFRSEELALEFNDGHAELTQLVEP